MSWFQRLGRTRTTTVHASRRSSDSPDSNASDYLVDSPVVNASSDQFRRARWAERLATTLASQRDPESLVVGVYARWGAGKTSALNMVYAALTEDPTTIPVRFNPWRLGDESEMFRGFFATLADALDGSLTSPGERVGQVLRDYGDVLAAVPVVGKIVEEGARVAATKLSESNLTKQRAVVERLLERHQRRVVILIDDIDRLDKAEIQAMFRLVKVAADFRHTAYVLAFDHAVVADALAERYQPGTPHGANFMDKIIQLPLYLPPAPSAKLREIALTCVDQALAQSRIELTRDELAEFVSAFDRAVAPRLDTPRAAKRYGNALLFAMPMIGEEVNPVDLMLIEAMRVCFPSLYEWVRMHRQSVLGPLTSVAAGDSDEFAELRQVVNELTAQHGSYGMEQAKSLLATLFPRTESAWENKVWGHQWDEVWNAKKRITSNLYFRRYFTYAIPEGDIADADIDALLLELASPTSASEIRSLARGVFSPGAVDTVLPKIAAKIPSLSPTEATRLAIVISELSAEFSDQQVVFGLSVTERAALLVRDLLSRIDSGSREEVATTLMRSTEDLSFAVELVRWLSAPNDGDADLGEHGQESETAGRMLAERLARIWSGKDPLVRLGRQVAGSLDVCNSFGRGPEVRGAIRAHIESDIDFADELLRSYLGQPWSLSAEAASTPSLRPETYEAFNEFIDAPWLFQQLQRAFGEDIGDDSVSAAAAQDRPSLIEQWAERYRRNLSDD